MMFDLCYQACRKTTDRAQDDSEPIRYGELLPAMILPSMQSAVKSSISKDMP